MTWAEAKTSVEEKFDLLLEENGLEYGWDYDGNKSWGGKWQRRAVSQANNEIRNAIADMANLEQFERFTEVDIQRKLETQGKGNYSQAKAEGGHELGVKYDDGKKKTNKEWRKYRNNFIVVVDNVRIKPGTAWSKTEKNWKQERSWEASATVLYDVRIYGKL
jgi:hypothetical protein